MNELKKIKYARGWNNSEMAEFLGINKPTLDKWLSGAGMPRARTLKEVAIKLDVDPGNLAESLYSNLKKNKVV